PLQPRRSRRVRWNAWLGRVFTFKRPLHDDSPFVNDATYSFGGLIWQQIRNPKQTTLVLPLGYDLHGCIVVLEHVAHRSVGKTPTLLINIHNQLPDHHSIGKCHDTRPRLQTHISNQTWDKTLMDSADVANDRPYFFGIGVDRNLFVNGCHKLNAA